MENFKTIGEVLDPTLSSNPESPAVEAVSGVWSYDELDQQARRVAGALWSLGVRPGDRVAACLPNDLDIVAAFHGTQRIGAIWAGIGEALSEDEQDDVRELCRPSVILAGERCRLTSPEVLDAGRWSDLLDRDETAPTVDVDIDAPAGIAFTSGTSGRPKAVVHSQRNLLLPGAALRAGRGYDRTLRKGDSFPLTILNLMVLST
ncbi:acyl--CoA ligase, partial [Streptomyces sp. SID10244]|nr:acyl--CoA ligase [Streptomyces sp. SID10244]